MALTPVSEAKAPGEGDCQKNTNTRFVTIEVETSRSNVSLSLLPTEIVNMCQGKAQLEVPI